MLVSKIRGGWYVKDHVSIQDPSPGLSTFSARYTGSSPLPAVSFKKRALASRVV